jgi:hypothetical protein
MVLKFSLVHESYLIWYYLFTRKYARALQQEKQLNIHRKRQQNTIYLFMFNHFYKI